MRESAFGFYYQHSFALLTLSGRNATVEYYELDWNCHITTGCTWYDPVKVWSETL